MPSSNYQAQYSETSQFLLSLKFASVYEIKKLELNHPVFVWLCFFWITEDWIESKSTF